MFALGEIDLDGLKEAIHGRREQDREAHRLRVGLVEAKSRRAQMLEEAIGDARSSEARSRLVQRFEEALTELEAARRALAEPEATGEPRLTPELLRRLEVFRDPGQAWDRFTQRTRKEVVRALARTISIHPAPDGYVLAIDWEGGGRAAAKVTTARRRKLFPIPDDVLALFDRDLADGGVSRRVEARSWTSYRSSTRTCWRPCGSRSRTGT